MTGAEPDAPLSPSMESTEVQSDKAKGAPRRRGVAVWLALTAAPPTVALPVGLAFVAVHSRLDGSDATAFTYASFCVVLALFALIVAWSFGLAWHLLALRRKWRLARTYAWAGAVIGVALTAAVVAFAAWTQYDLLVRMLTIAWFGTWGALTGAATGWLIWFMRRPDRDAVPNITAEFE